MSLSFARLTAGSVLIFGTLGAGFFAVQGSNALKSIPSVPQHYLERAPAAAHPTPSGAHGGAAPAGGHGAPATAAPAAHSGSPIMSIDEVYANIAGEGTRSHSFAIKVELELFEETARTTVEERTSVVRATILETARQHDYRSLTSLTGKLYFKESLVARINEALGGPAVRDVHFSSFYLQ